MWQKSTCYSCNINNFFNILDTATTNHINVFNRRLPFGKSSNKSVIVVDDSDGISDKFHSGSEEFEEIYEHPADRSLNSAIKTILGIRGFSGICSFPEVPELLSSELD